MNPLILSRFTITWVAVLFSTSHPLPVRAEPSPNPESPVQQEVQAKAPSSSSTSPSTSCAPSPGLAQEPIQQAVSSSAAVVDCLDFETEFKEFTHLLATIETQLTHSHNPKIRRGFPGASVAAFWKQRELMIRYSANAKPFKLTPKEYLAILFYSASGSKHTNGILASGDKADVAAIQPLLTLIDSGLNKLPDYKGEVLRGADIQPGQSPGDPLKGYKPEKIITSKIYTSSSSSSVLPPTFLYKNTHFKIVSKHGKDISKFSSMDHEKEVLFPRGARFKVLRSSLPKGPRSPYEIDLEEMESENP